MKHEELAQLFATAKMVEFDLDDNGEFEAAAEGSDGIWTCITLHADGTYSINRED